MKYIILFLIYLIIISYFSILHSDLEILFLGSIFACGIIPVIAIRISQL